LTKKNKKKIIFCLIKSTRESIRGDSGRVQIFLVRLKVSRVGLAH